MKVLLVEDDAVSRRLLEQIVRIRGHEVDAFERAEDAERCWDEHQHRLVLLDWLLVGGGADGLKLCRRLRSNAGGDEIVIIVITAQSRPEHLRRVLEAGADDYVTKPLDLPLLDVRLSVAERNVEHAAKRRQYLDALIHDSTHDGLTGLSNRAYLAQRLRDCLAKVARRANYQFAVLFLDLNRFTLVNEAIGQRGGNAVLRMFADRLSSWVRAEDLVVRIDGDEFAVLMEDVNSTGDAARLAERIHESLREGFEVDSQTIYLRVAIGIAMSDVGYGTPDAIIRAAGVARSKARHDSQQAPFMFFGEEMLTEAMHEVRIGAELRDALADEQFRLCYQPIVELPSRRIVGLEVLVRWQHPERGLLPPSAFVPIAEKNGLIVQLGAWVLRRACEALARWTGTCPEAADLTVNVNLSPRQLLDPGLVGLLESVLQDTKIDPRRLGLEITETVFVQNTDASSEALRALKALNVDLVMDDFGTEYAVLGLLLTMPFDKIKIDRSFTAPLETSPKHRAVVRSIVKLAESLGMETVAEGIERPAQFHELVGMECGLGQGFYFAPGVPEGMVEKLLTEGVGGPTGESDDTNGVEESRWRSRGEPREAAPRLDDLGIGPMDVGAPALLAAGARLKAQLEAQLEAEAREAEQVQHSQMAQLAQLEQLASQRAQLEAPASAQTAATAPAEHGETDESARLVAAVVDIT